MNMDEILKALVDAIAAGGMAAVWIGIGWLSHKVIMVGIVSWAVVKMVSKVMDTIMARVVLHGFVEKVAISCGMQTPLSPSEQEEILSRLRAKPSNGA